MKKPIAVVSDHAVIRYLERVYGVDIEGLRRRIGRRVDRAVKLGASAAVAGGFVYQIKEGTVTTVAPASSPNVRTGRQRRERPE